MKAVSLLCVLMLGKGLTLIGRDLAISWWTPLAYFWQDFLVALLFAVVDYAVRRDWFGWLGYGTVVVYTAFNVALVSVLSSPMTWPMLRAARGTISDSIDHHLTGPNLLLICAVLLAGVAFPWSLKWVETKAARNFKSAAFQKRPRLGAWLVISLIFVGLGPGAAAHLDTAGLHRNAVVALVTTVFPRISAHPASQDWRASPFENQAPATVRASLSSQADWTGSHRDGTTAGLLRFRGGAVGRNVILISLESTGAKYLRSFGAQADPMPNLTELAKQAMRFENAYAVYPESIKGLFSVLCSRYPALDTKPDLYQHISTPSLVQALARAGYRTALFHSGRFMYLGMEAVIRNRGFQILEDAGDIGGNHNSSFGVDEPSTVHRILRWIDALRPDEHFLVTYLPIAGHHPYDSPEPGPFPEKDERGRYLNALHYGDAALGELLQGLRARGLDQRTLFVFFGDHGEAFGQHEGNFGHTLRIYDENVHVPLLLAAPGVIRESVCVAQVASLIDIAPTILDLLGLPVPRQYQGQSLLESHEAMALHYTDYSLGLLGLRDGPWKFILELESGRSKLFNLAVDAGEKNDLAGQLPERVSAYRGHLKRWSAAQRDLIMGAR